MSYTMNELIRIAAGRIAVGEVAPPAEAQIPDPETPGYDVHGRPLHVEAEPPRAKGVNVNAGAGTGAPPLPQPPGMNEFIRSTARRASRTGRTKEVIK